MPLRSDPPRRPETSSRAVPPAAGRPDPLPLLLSRFYDEIRTPLLSDIRVDYPPDAVEQVTRTLFPNYFNGSEIIVAGKLADRAKDRLHVEVTASNSKKFVVLKKDVPVEPRWGGSGGPGGPGPQGGGQEEPNPLERLWSYLTLKELQSSWLQSDQEQERDRLRRKAQALAVAGRFLTPFTSMKLRPAPQAHTPEATYGLAGMSAATGPETVMQSLRGTQLQPGNSTAAGRGGGGGAFSLFRALPRRFYFFVLGELGWCFGVYF